MASIPRPERELIEEYGWLPTKSEIERLRTELAAINVDLDDEWRDYWGNAPMGSNRPKADLLERLYMFWMLIRGRLGDEQKRALIRDSGVERSQAPTDSED